MEYNSSVLSLGYLISEDKEKVLLLYHNQDSTDLSYGKYNGYSDFLNIDESSLDCFKRIVFELTGVNPFNIKFKGSIQWSNFRDEGKSFFAQIFIANIDENKIEPINKFGENRWITIDEINRGDIPMWHGDKHILPLVFDEITTPFHGFMQYEEGHPADWLYSRA